MYPQKGCAITECFGVFTSLLMSKIPQVRMKGSCLEVTGVRPGRSGSIR